MVLGIEFSRIKDAAFFSALIHKMCPKMSEYESREDLAERIHGPVELGDHFSRPSTVTEVDIPWFDTTKGIFIMSELPREIKVLLKKIGVKKKDLKKKKTAKMYFDIIHD